MTRESLRLGIIKVELPRQTYKDFRETVYDNNMKMTDAIKIFVDNIINNTDETILFMFKRRRSNGQTND